MITSRFYRAAIFIALAAFALPTLHAQTAATPEQIAAGSKLFQGMCVTCHGFDGGGGDAPSLNRPVLSRAPDDDALRAVISQGIPDKGMPRVRSLSDEELNDLAAYVRSLGVMHPSTITGNASNGRVVYTRSACASCHIVNGEGGSLGPELTSIGELRSADYLRQAIVSPGKRLPRGTLAVPARGYQEFLLFRVVTNDGKEIRGNRMDEDALSIQLRDASNKIYSFRKSDLKTIEPLPGKSLMPSFDSRLSKTELDDLVAYLSTLRGAQ
jgi:putative heme-binding domain-containing protein